MSFSQVSVNTSLSLLSFEILVILKRLFKVIYFTYFYLQLESFRSLTDADGNPIVDNFRPPQPLNGRHIGCGGKSDGETTDPY